MYPLVDLGSSRECKQLICLSTSHVSGSGGFGRSQITSFPLFSKAGFLFVTAGAILELTFVEQTDLELTEVHPPLPPKC